MSLEICSNGHREVCYENPVTSKMGVKPPASCPVCAVTQTTAAAIATVAGQLAKLRVTLEKLPKDNGKENHGDNRDPA